MVFIFLLVLLPLTYIIYNILLCYRIKDLQLVARGNPYLLLHPILIWRIFSRQVTCNLTFDNKILGDSKIFRFFVKYLVLIDYNFIIASSIIIFNNYEGLLLHTSILCIFVLCLVLELISFVRNMKVR